MSAVQLDLLERDWVEEAYETVWNLPSGKTFTTDDLHPMLRRPDQANWWGVLMATCRGCGIVSRIGYRPSERPEANGRVVAIWQRR